LLRFKSSYSTTGFGHPYLKFIMFSLKNFSLQPPLPPTRTENQSSLPFQKQYQQQWYIYHRVYPPPSIPLITQKIIARHNWSQLCLLLKRLQVIPHPRPNPELLPTRWRELGWVKSLGLLVQHEDVAVWAAGRWRPGTGVVRDKGCVTGYEVYGAVGGLFGLETWLDP